MRARSTGRVPGKPHYVLSANPWRRPLVAERTTDGGRTYIVRNDLGVYVTGLAFRYVCALTAAEAGHVHAVRRRRNWYGMYDEWMEYGCDLFGIAHATFWVLDRDKLVEPLRGRERGEPIGLTERGAKVLAAIRAAGCETLLTERLAG